MPNDLNHATEPQDLPANPALQMLWADGVAIMHRDNPPMIVFRFANLLPEMNYEIARIAVSKEQAKLMVQSLATVLDFWPEKPSASDSDTNAED